MFQMETLIFKWLMEGSVFSMLVSQMAPPSLNLMGVLLNGEINMEGGTVGMVC